MWEPYKNTFGEIGVNPLEELCAKAFPGRIKRIPVIAIII